MTGGESCQEIGRRSLERVGRLGLLLSAGCPPALLDAADDRLRGLADHGCPVTESAARQVVHLLRRSTLRAVR